MRSRTPFLLLALSAWAGGCMALPGLPAGATLGANSPETSDFTDDSLATGTPMPALEDPTPSESRSPEPATPDDGEVSQVVAASAHSTRLTPLEAEAAADLLARAWGDATGAEPSAETLAVLLAHWAFETGRGQKMIGHNFAGLKGSAPAGGSVRLWTNEWHGADTVRVLRTFRAYASAEAGARDYVDLLGRRYPRAARAADRGSVIDFVNALGDGGYFTAEASAYLRAMRLLWIELVEELRATHGADGK